MKNFANDNPGIWLHLSIACQRCSATATAAAACGVPIDAGVYPSEAAGTPAEEIHGGLRPILYAFAEENVQKLPPRCQLLVGAAGAVWEFLLAHPDADATEVTAMLNSPGVYLLDAERAMTDIGRKPIETVDASLLINILRANQRLLQQFDSTIAVQWAVSLDDSSRFADLHLSRRLLPSQMFGYASINAASDYFGPHLG